MANVKIGRGVCGEEDFEMWEVQGETDNSGYGRKRGGFSQAGLMVVTNDFGK